MLKTIGGEVRDRRWKMGVDWLTSSASLDRLLCQCDPEPPLSSSLSKARIFSSPRVCLGDQPETGVRLAGVQHLVQKKNAETLKR